MFLFIIDLSIELESSSPIIYKLNKHYKKKVNICSINFMQRMNNNKVLQYLISKGINFDDYPVKNSFYYLWKFFLTIFNFLPVFILKRFRNFFRSVYVNKVLFNKEQLKKYLLKKNIKIVSIDTSVPNIKKKIISYACRELKIKLIGYNTGPEIIFHSGKITSDYLKIFDFYLEQNKLRNIAFTKKLKNKIKILGSARYCEEWINQIKKIYKLKDKKKANSSKKIGIFLTQKTQNLPINHQLIQKLIKMKKFEVKLRNKPRDYMPNKCCDFHNDEMDTTELTDWSDIIISTQTSAILEALVKRKKVIFLNHLIPKSYGHWNYKFKNTIYLTKNDNDVIKILNNKKNKLNYKKYLKVAVGNEKKYNILNSYYNFYKRLINTK